jgi:cytochrome P450
MWRTLLTLSWQTIVGMSSYLQHRNPEAFPEPSKFDPTRWINQPPEVMRLMEKCFVPFSRGSRMCIGQNLAMCELYVTLGTLFRRFDDLRPTYHGPLEYIDLFNIYHPEEAQKLKVEGPKGGIS